MRTLFLKLAMSCIALFPFSSDCIEQTLSIIKPDAVCGNHIGEIVARFEKNGLRIAAMKMLHLDEDQAKGFYAVHQHRPFSLS